MIYVYMDGASACVCVWFGWLLLDRRDRHIQNTADGINGSTRTRRVVVAARWLDSGHPMASRVRVTQCSLFLLISRRYCLCGTLLSYLTTSAGRL